MSKKYTLNLQDLKSIGITLGLAVVAFVLTQLINLVPLVDFGKNDQLVTIIVLGLLKALQKSLQGE